MRSKKQGFRIRAERPAAIAGMLAFALCIPAPLIGTT